MRDEQEETEKLLRSLFCPLQKRQHKHKQNYENPSHHRPEFAWTDLRRVRTERIPAVHAYAAAAGVARALGLNVEQTANAVAISGTANNALRVTRTGKLSNWKGLAYPNTVL